MAFVDGPYQVATIRATDGPQVVIHGGAGATLKSQQSVMPIRASLHRIVRTLYDQLQQGASAIAVVVQGCQMLEDDPLFNAGTGAVLQSDGQVRLSAALMDGHTQTFSGVINAQRVRYPIQLAHFLQTQPDRVIADVGAIELARELQLPPYNPVTPQRLQEWVNQTRDGAVMNLVADMGTIGVVARDNHGRLAVGTSTGGKGGERIGRVSDSAMPAGTYANHQAAVSCTGIGEDIIDECLAARIVIRVTDGLTLAEAFERSFREAAQRGRDLGAIGLDVHGNIAWGKTTDILLAAYANGTGIQDTLS
ncbi:MAG: isoaspartyl peptidase/L-asparaginase [Gloeomargarita sp. SKYBB_i_bin120]|nr:isoaspartyl peptidase/L-asparaginase [Gloeomargarita sp. SKYG98]MCS7292076.1 isoaspartyl peptidase/L-asparaginase [Gloeomargarita sp. SKYB120]MDW8177636.1 isoaspartyl peptidase/L-asparaginase [Gloeomargarita sp. SKYBB_i_bin120]